jgi:PAT family beta-lactamase induction signal transducer AmpG
MQQSGKDMDDPRERTVSVTSRARSWLWVPSLYFAEGIPYVLVMTLSVIFYKRMGISNTDIALYTSWLYLPWVIKPLWSPVVDILKTKRFWILVMQLCVGAGLAGVALSIPASRFFQYTLAFFWLVAFSSATHDIAADGFYMLGLTRHDQAFFVGIRSTFYRIAMLTGQGLLVILAGYFEARTGLPEVEVGVVASGQEGIPSFEPGEVAIQTDTSDIYFFTRNQVEIGRGLIPADSAKRLMAAVEQWNREHRFYSGDEQPALQSETDGSTGNMGLTWFYLSKRPEEGERIVLHFSFEKGDKSIALVRSYRFEFNGQNWNVPAFALFQVDPKLNRASSATFSGLSGNIRLAWTIVFAIIAVLFAGFFLYHRFILPGPEEDRPGKSRGGEFIREFIGTFVEFFRKKHIGVILTFLLVYRLGESQLVKLASPFLLDSQEAGGLGLTTGDLGLIYGTIGIIALSVGGIIGGIAASARGLKYWLWWMVIAMNLPNLVYVFLSFVMPSSLWVVGASVAVEQFGYGFGFTAYMLYMIYVSEGRHKTAHFAITTGFMALGMMLPGMISGWIQELVGYRHFFIWVAFCTIPGFAVIPFLKIDPSFGKKARH